MKNCHLSVEADAHSDDLKLIRDSLDESNMIITGDRNYRPLFVSVREDNGALTAGLIGDMWGGWLHITYLWVNEAMRGLGTGKKLVAAAEEQAKSNGCRGVYLETFSFQARPFYEKLGYVVCGEIPDYPQGHTYYFMRKLF